MALSWHAAILEPYAGTLAERCLREDREKGRVYFEDMFSPKVREIKLWSRGREVESVKPLFSGYLFLRFDMNEYGWPCINDVRGIKTIMYGGSDTPARIRDVSIDALKSVCSAERDEHGVLHHYLRQQDADYALFEVGRKIVWTPSWASGPVTAQIVWTQGDRLRVMFELLGAKRPVELLKKDVELVR